MSIQPHPSLQHPLATALATVRAVLGEVAHTPAWSLPGADVAAVVAEATAAMSQLAEVRARAVHQATLAGLPRDSGASSTAAWLAQQTRMRRREAAAEVRAAAALAAHETTRNAMAAGAVLSEQARVIAAAVDALPADLEPGLRAAAEEHLLDRAVRFDADALRHLGRHLLAVVDPEAADAHTGRLLEAQEREAAATTRFTMRDNSDGTWTGRFRLPDLHAHQLRKALEALASPRRAQPADGHEARDEEDRGGYPGRLGRAFCELVEHLPVDRLPGRDRNRVTLVVTIPLSHLTTGLGYATLDTGAEISAGQARRLACAAGIIPMVLGGDSVPLDLGREQRLYSRYQRVAMHQQATATSPTHHAGCAATGCDRPPAWTDAHHREPWVSGGTTVLDQAVPLCGFHHHLAHHPRWRTTYHAPGHVTFHRRT